MAFAASAGDPLMRDGLFRDALVAARAERGIDAHRTPEHVLLVADLLQRTGDGRRASEMARPYVVVETFSASVRARSHMILGNECREKGDTTKGVFHFQRAITLAGEAGEHELQCWCQLRLMLALAETSGAVLSGDFISELRANVFRLGNPEVTAALHFFVAQLETRRGLLEYATQHLHVADNLLATSPNVWLEGVGAVAASCIYYIQSDFDRALKEARTALQRGHRSGHRSTERAALANLGHLYLSGLRLRYAERRLWQALKLSKGGESLAGILDGLAQVRLAHGRFDECDRLLRRINRREAPVVGGVEPYYRLWAFVTRLKLLKRVPDSLNDMLLRSRAAESRATTAICRFTASTILRWSSEKARALVAHKVRTPIRLPSTTNGVLRQLRNGGECCRGLF